MRIVTDSYQGWIVSLRQNVQQISRRDKVEPGEGETLGLQILRKGLLTDGQTRGRTSQSFN